MHSFIAEHSQFMIVFIKTHCNTNMQTNTHKHKHTQTHKWLQNKKIIVKFDVRYPQGYIVSGGWAVLIIREKM